MKDCIMLSHDDFVTLCNEMTHQCVLLPEFERQAYYRAVDDIMELLVKYKMTLSHK